MKGALEVEGIRVKRLIVFGSHAQGRGAADSDIDVAIISDDFRGMTLLERLETIGGILARARIMEPIECLAWTEEELRAKGEGSFVADEVKMKGVEVL
jgi:predicted nucleotidyltransferase